MNVERCRPIELPVVENPQGDLAFAEGKNHIPFPIARVFYVYGIPGGAIRGGHAHRTLEEVVFCLKGRLEIVAGDGERRRTFVLDDPRKGLYLPPLIWYDIEGFSPDTIYFGLTSADYDEDDYIRDYDEYREAVRAAASDR